MYPDIVKADVNPLDHFVVFGIKEGRLPGYTLAELNKRKKAFPDFDWDSFGQIYKWHQDTNESDQKRLAVVTSAPINANACDEANSSRTLSSFAAAVTSPNSTVSLFNDPDANPDYEALIDWDYCMSQNGSPKRYLELRDRSVSWPEDLKPNRFFDPAWYARVHRLDPKQDALSHFITHSWMPAPFFCSKSYSRENPDAGTGRKAFLHFLKLGVKERRSLGLDAEAVATLRKLHRDYDWTAIDATELLPDPNTERVYPPEFSGPTALSHTAAVDELQLDDFIRRSTKARLVSFDVWDTLLRRDCHPDEVKLHTAEILRRELEGSRVTTGVTASGLFKLRQLAEWRIADLHYEYRFSEVLTEWLVLCGVADEVERTRLSERLLKSEVEFEIKVTRVDPTGLAMLTSLPDVPKIALSDFYLSGDALSNILAHHGIAKHFRKVYVSSDLMLTKREGTLFVHAISEENVQARQILHIGDNPIADAAVPAAMGINTLLYVDQNEIRRKAYFTARFQAQLKRDGMRLLHSLIRQDSLSNVPDGRHAAIENGHREKQGSSHYEASIELLALGFLGFGMFILNKALAINADRVFFANREGTFFRRVCNLLIDCNVFNRDKYPHTQDIAVSRRATLAPSLRSFCISELMRIWSQYSTQSMEALAYSLNLDLPTMEKFCSDYGIPLKEAVQYPWQDIRVLAMFNNAHFCAWGNESILKQRHAILEYLELSGFESADASDCFFVDIGWRGTIQDNLARLVRGRIEGAYLALYPYLTEQPLNSVKHGFLANHNIESDQYDLRRWAALEFITNGCGGSVIGYEGGIPQRQLFKDEEKFLVRYIEPIQQQLIDAMAQTVRTSSFKALTLDSWRDVARSAFQTFLEDPAVEIADMFHGLMHNETFGTGEVRTMDHSLPEGDDVTPADLHASVGKILRTAPWPEAWLRSKTTRDTLAHLSLDRRIALPRHPGFTPAPSIVRSLGHSIAIFSPPPIWGSGGHRTIYKLARSLDAAGYSVDLFSEARGEYEYKEQELSGTDVRLHDAWFAGVNSTAAVSTIWHSASYLTEFIPDQIKKFYFIQDMEALFSPMSDGYLRAENSYALDLNAICIGRWLPHVLRSQFGRGAASCGLGVDTSIYHPISNPELKKRFPRRDEIAVLYQPEKWRRAPDLCLAALDIVKRQRPDVEITFYGSTERPNTTWRARHLGLIDDLNELNVVYNSAKIGLCISLSNPSRIPFEMMASGCVPVDVYRYNNLFDYADGTALLAYQTPASLASAMLSLLDDEADWEARSQRCMKVGANRTMAWELDSAVNALEFCIDGGDINEMPTPKASYTAAPHFAEIDSTSSVNAWCQAQRAQAAGLGATVAC